MPSPPIARLLLRGRQIAEAAGDISSPLQGVAQIRQALGIPQLVGGGPPLPIPEIPFQGPQGNPILELLYTIGKPDTLAELYIWDDDVDAIENLSLDRTMYEKQSPMFTLDEVEDARKKTYAATQSALAAMPDEVTVYRIGDLPGDAVKSFTLDPNYAFSQHLPWADRLGGRMTTYRVKKSAILAAPDAVIRPDIGELEVLINTDDVTEVGE